MNLHQLRNGAKLVAFLRKKGQKLFQGGNCIQRSILKQKNRIGVYGAYNVFSNFFGRDIFPILAVDIPKDAIHACSPAQSQGFLVDDPIGRAKP